MSFEKSRSNSEFPEVDLWDEMRYGNNIAYSKIYDAYAQILFSYGCCFTSDRELVKDCIQEVFVRIYQNRANLSSTSNVRFYLMLALKNELFQEFRKQSKATLLDIDSLPFAVDFSQKASSIEDETRQESLKQIVRALNDLPVRQKEIMHYRYIDGLSIDEICQLMDLKYQSAQNLIQRALKKLQSFFTDSSILTLLTLFNGAQFN